jgi:hypothetical protein
MANLKQLFRMPQFLGIAGGRPNRSLYFVASQGKYLRAGYFCKEDKMQIFSN